jgi:tetratricopeptide (TPR) repeat protein
VISAPPLYARARAALSRSVRLQALVLALVTFGLYANSIEGAFQYDDFHHVVRNPHIRTLANLPRFFAHPEMWSVEGFPGNPENPYRPLTMASFCLNWALHRDALPGYHLTSVALHVLCSIVLLVLLRTLMPFAPAGAFLAALLFAVHAINSQAVNYVSSRGEVLATLFYWLAFTCYVKARATLAGRRRIALVGLALLGYALSMLSKETGVTLPLVLLAYEWLLAPRAERRWRTVTGRLIPFAALAVGYLVLRRALLGFMIDRDPPQFFAIGETGKSPFSNLLTQAGVLLYYVKLLLIPTRLAVDRMVYAVPTIDFRVVLEIDLWVAVVACAWWARHRQPLVPFALAWFFVTLLPTTLIPLNVVVNEHRLYLAAVAWTIAAGLLLHALRGRRLAGPAFGVVLASLALLTWHRNRDWHDELSFWTHELEVSQGNYRTVSNYSSILVMSGRLDDAILNFERNLHRFVHDPRIRYLLGNLYAMKHRDEEAVTQFRASLRLDLTSPPVYSALAASLTRLGRKDEAADALRGLLLIDSTSASAHNDLGVIALEQRHYEDAAARFRNAARLAPSLPEPHYNLGLVEHALGRDSLAARAWRRALACDPNYAFALHDLRALPLEGVTDKLARVRALLADGRPTAARQVLVAMVARDPSSRPALDLLVDVMAEVDSAGTALATIEAIVPRRAFRARALSNLGSRYASLSKDAAALYVLDRAAELEPGLWTARYNRGTVLLDAGQVAPARREFEAALASNPDAYEVHYNLACALALDHQPDASLAHLGRAIELGFNDRAHMRADPQLSSLASEPRFRALLER